MLAMVGQVCQTSLLDEVNSVVDLRHVQLKNARTKSEGQAVSSTPYYVQPLLETFIARKIAVIISNPFSPILK
jgi:hypothetical protein